MYLHKLVIAIILSHVIAVRGLVTLQTIRDITNVTEECREQIMGKEIEREGMLLVVGVDGVGEQSVLSGGHGDEDGEDVEDVRLPFSFLSFLELEIIFMK
jgi:hypothetical protein